MPAALVELDKDLAAAALLFLTILGLVFGLGFARSRVSAWVAAILGSLAGICLVAIIIGRLLPPPSLLWREITYAADWLRLGRQGMVIWPPPLSSSASYFWQRLSDLGIRLWWWSQTAASGGPAQDPILLVLVAALASWAAGFFAAWQIYRRWRPLVGLLPSGLCVSVLAFFVGGMAIYYLMVSLFCTLWLVAVCHLWTQVERWERAGADYPGSLGTELLLAVGPWFVGLLVLAAFFPVISLRQIRDSFWKVMDAPWSTVEQMSERLFGPMEGTGLGSGGEGGHLPRSHLLGGGPELGETIMFYVSTNDPPLPWPEMEEMELLEPQSPPRYWRSVTYDTYTGQGWTNGPLERRTLSSGESLNPSLPPGFELAQQFDVLVAEGNLLYAANAPLQVDHPLQSWWRAPGDMAQLSSDADRYTVISRPPEPSANELQAVPAILPPDLAERYLALPDTVPQRVLDLAEQVAGDTDNRYDQAHAIEFFLRTYTYTLDVPLPPADSDLVDHFLFDLQEGYCDYYASSMVVMARAIGIPARLATGYAQGTYDHDEGRWVVLEKDGHSWVEVYFDGIGWVEFEPTAGLPALTRTGGDLSGPVVPPLPPRTLGQGRFPWALLVLGGMLALLAAFVVMLWRPRRYRADSASELIRNRHARLLRWGARLREPLRDGQTPYEYGAVLGNTLHARGQDSRWRQARQASAKAPTEVEHLTDAFVRTQYSSEPISYRQSWQIRDLWTRLRRHLLWLWLGR
jgi:transglutaminase-like putative cysteine protease